MQNLTITEAVKMIPVSESKLRRDLSAGVVSCEVDEKGKNRFDPSELRRVYGELTLPDDSEQVNGSTQLLSETGHDSPKIVVLLEQQVSDLRKDLERANDREKKLISVLETAQQNASRLLPAPERQGWVRRLLGIGTG